MWEKWISRGNRCTYPSRYQSVGWGGVTCSSVRRAEIISWTFIVWKFNPCQDWYGWNCRKSTWFHHHRLFNCLGFACKWLPFTTRGVMGSCTVMFRAVMGTSTCTCKELHSLAMYYVSSEAFYQKQCMDEFYLVAISKSSPKWVRVSHKFVTELWSYVFSRGEWKFHSLRGDGESLS